jgi:hypothetical protein
LKSDMTWWSADGLSVYTRSLDATGATSFWSVPLDGGAPRQLITFDGSGLSPSRGGWEIVQGQLVYPAAEQRADVYVLEVNAP